MSGKGDTPRKVNRKKWDDCPLWENMKKDALWDNFPEVHVPPGCGIDHNLTIPELKKSLANKKEETEAILLDVMEKYKNALAELSDK